MTNYIGIDPGITGAIAVVNSDGHRVYDMPVVVKGGGKGRVKTQVDPAGLKKLLVPYCDGVSIVFLERVASMPGQGVASMFSMGDSYGCIRGVVAAMGFRLEITTPAVWKKYYGLGSDKELARAKAIELFPDVQLNRKKDHNRAEALLIANFGREQGDVEQRLRRLGAI